MVGALEPYHLKSQDLPPEVGWSPKENGLVFPGIWDVVWMIISVKGDGAVGPV
jgi:hypothetical protein